MSKRAWQQLSRVTSRRRGVVARLSGFFLAVLLAPASWAETIISAEYAFPTGRYPHGALGDASEHEALRVQMREGYGLTVRFTSNTVFEDTAPRIADLDGDGLPEVIAVESDENRGARLSVWGVRDKMLVRIAATDPIGRRFRWLAPLGVGDLDGDGRVEIAYVETPHLGKVLKIVRLEGDRLAHVTQAAGLTNHRIGEPFIQGGVYRCSGRVVMLTADAGWRRIIGSILDDGKLHHWDLGTYGGPESFDRVEGCKPLNPGG